MPNEIPVVFHNNSNYDYNFIIKKLPNEYEGQFECIGKNAEKHKTLSFRVEKEITEIDKNGKESFATISSSIY